MDAVTAWAALIGDIGFPAALVFYLLIRWEKRIDRIVDALEKEK